MNHLEFAALESAMLERPGDLAFSRFVDQVEQLLGVDDLDGDEEEDGFSMDSAHDAFEAGITPAAYAQQVLDGLAGGGGA